MPSWVPYMVASCLAATIIGYALAWSMDEFEIWEMLDRWRNKR